MKQIHVEDLFEVIPPDADGVEVVCAFGLLKIARNGRVAVRFDSEFEDRIVVHGKEATNYKQITFGEFPCLEGSSGDSIVMQGDDHILGFIRDDSGQISFVAVTIEEREIVLHLAADMIRLGQLLRQAESH